MFDFSNPPNDDTDVAIVHAFCKGKIEEDTFTELVDDEALAERWIRLAEEMSQPDLEEMFGQFMLMSIFQRVSAWNPSFDSEDLESGGGSGLDDMFR